MSFIKSKTQSGNRGSVAALLRNATGANDDEEMSIDINSISDDNTSSVEPQVEVSVQEDNADIVNEQVLENSSENLESEAEGDNEIEGVVETEAVEAETEIETEENPVETEEKPVETDEDEEENELEQEQELEPEPELEPEAEEKENPTTISINTISSIVNIVEAYNRINKEYQDIVVRIVSNNETVDVPQFIHNVLQVDLNLPIAINALKEACIKNQRERIFYLISLDEEILDWLGDIVSLFTDKDIIENENPSKNEFLDALEAAIDNLKENDVAKISAIDSVLKTLVPNK